MTTPPDIVWKGKTFRDLVNDAKTRIEEVDAATLKQWQTNQQDIVILDVREPEDFAQGHIQGAINVPRGLLELEIDEVVPDQGKTIVTYCGGGSRSALAADTLQIMGYDHVYSLAQGWRGWNQQ